MTLQKMGEFGFDHINQQDDLYKVMSAQEIKQAFDSRGNELKAIINKLIDSLQSKESGDSGSKNIGVTKIGTLTGDNVQDILESLKDFVDTKAYASDVFSKNDLNSVIVGNSGADKIKATPMSGSPNTVQGILEWLKDQINTAALGQIPDGSITPQKLKFTPVDVTHLNDPMPHKSVDAITGKTYKWGLGVQNGNAFISYEEV